MELILTLVLIPFKGVAVVVIDLVRPVVRIAIVAIVVVVVVVFPVVVPIVVLGFGHHPGVSVGVGIIILLHVKVVKVLSVLQEPGVTHP